MSRNAAASSAEELSSCPVCQKSFPYSVILSHVDACLSHEEAPNAQQDEVVESLGIHATARELDEWLRKLRDRFDSRRHLISDEDVHELREFCALLRRNQRKLEAFTDELVRSRKQYRFEGSSSKREDPAYAIDHQSQLDEETKLLPLPKEEDVEMQLDLRNDPDPDREFRELLEREAMCNVCHMIDPSEVVHLEACGHNSCRACLTSAIRERLKVRRFGDVVQCPRNDCEVGIPMFILQQVLDANMYSEVEKASVEEILVDKSKFTSCPSCKEVFEKVAGDFQNEAKDSNQTVSGNPTTRASRRHRAQHRFRCNKCHTEWCSACSSVPYHNGMDCKQFKDYSCARHCRFCSAALDQENTLNGGALADVCTSADCTEKAALSCKKIKSCSHPCGGIISERRCLPCLRCKTETVVNANDYCNICWVESVGAAPAIELRCGHIFHHNCVVKKLTKRWTGARIVFSFLDCPLCKAPIAHSSLKAYLKPIFSLKRQIEEAALKRLSIEGLQKAPEIVSKDGRYFGDPTGYAMDRFAFYKCYKCQKPYCGGMRVCGDMQGQNGEEFDETHLVCGGCSGNTPSCAQHGKEFIEYKCRFCCSIATWFCWNTTHFCNECHTRQTCGDHLSRKPVALLPKCRGRSRCPLGGNHPPTGTEHSLGCALCKNNTVVDP